jgi:parallel beta-helix repeat protein
MIAAASELKTGAGIVVFAINRSSYTRNQIDGGDGIGIFLAGGITNAVVDKNQIRNGDGTGIFMVSGASSVPNSPVTIADNEITGRAGGGITAIFAPKLVIEKNLISGNGGRGIELLGSNDCDVIANEVRANARSGIFVEGENNRLLRNRSVGNAKNAEGFDLHDTTTGGGTAGTANTWIGNRCGTANPEAICAKRITK